MRPPESGEPYLDDVLNIEIIALLAEGVLERPCPWIPHAAWAEFDENGRLVCTVCHRRGPKATTP